jgi:O-antigen/teichoic acid export membrane protein
MQILEGVARFSVMLVMVALLHAKAAGGMFAAFSAQFLTVALGIALTYGLWKTKPAVSFLWKKWLRHAAPLTLGLGAILLMSSIDMVFVQGLFSDANSTALYGGAMLTGYAIIQFIAPVSLVMFARVAQSVARAERTDTLGMTLAATILFGTVAAIGCTILPWLPLRLIYLKNPEMMRAAPLVPWFAWALLPLTVANVLVQNILARAKFEAVPWLCLVPALYATALCLQAHHLLTLPPMIAFVRVIETLGLASLAMCAVAAWFSWSGRAAMVLDPGSAVGRSISDTANSRAE